MGFTSGISPYQAPNLVRKSIFQFNEIIFAKPEVLIKQGCQVAAAFPHIIPGDVLARITATGKFRRYTRCILNTTTSIGGSSFICKDSTTGLVMEPPFNAGEQVTLDIGGGGAENVTIASVVPATGTVNITGTFAAGHTAGVAIGLRSTVEDGSGTAVGIAGGARQHGAWDSGNLNLNFLLDQDYTMDIVLSGVLYKSKLRGMDAAAFTTFTVKDLSPAFDALIIR
jgi:hypothetical protein